MKKVLLLGDSIRRGYEPFVKASLEGKAEVVGTEENGRFAKYTLWSVDDWVKESGTPDVIHWNNGIWDLYHHTEEHGVFTAIDEYTSTIRRILSRLQKFNVPIVWATTTAVAAPFQHIKNEEVDLYNKEIVRIMQAEGVHINDLNAVIKENAAYIADDQFHLTEQGSKACAEAVVKAVSPFI